MALNRASEVSAANWLSQTHEENYRNFSHVAIRFFSEVEIPMKHSRLGKFDFGQNAREIILKWFTRHQLFDLSILIVFASVKSRLCFSALIALFY